MYARPDGDGRSRQAHLETALLPMTLSLLSARCSICRLDAGTTLPAWASRGDFWSVTRTPGELSVVCDTGAVPPGLQAEHGWRVLAVQGPLDFSLTGIIAELSTRLAAADVSVFVVSTYDTDYLLVRENDVDRSVAVLQETGHRVRDETDHARTRAEDASSQPTGSGERPIAGGILHSLPLRTGHFLLESGLHTDRWLTLDALFVDPARVAPLVAALAGRLRPHGAEAVCGPLLGGALLAHALATYLGIGFSYTAPRGASSSGGLFSAEYELAGGLAPLIRGKRVAVVDDAVSAGSSVRATIDALSAAGATTVVIGALLTLGTVALTHFQTLGMPVEALERQPLEMWAPAECPLCRADQPLESPP